MRHATGTLADLTLKLNEAIAELGDPVGQADGTLSSATSQINALLVWYGSGIDPADGTLADAVSTYNQFVTDHFRPALIERLCQVDEDETRNIPLNPFVEAVFGVLGGYHTVTQLKTFWSMTAADIIEMDALVARITAYPVDSTARMIAVHRVRSILTFKEQSLGLLLGDDGYVPGYSTVDEIRTRFGEI